ncbi:MAG: hypothetical protein IJK02_06240 [Clostridia bacterium]|nr:hypothetical protein [Clostridia bacterium]MBR0510124.1 hypothetical protein [Clostridia bacterium]MBR0536924.1 hypothetical protein [Clostridia bacterium]
MTELLDLHVYTNNSPGGLDKVSFLCEQAVMRDLRGIAFTDICAADAPDRAQTRRRLRHAFFDAAKAKHLFQESLLVLCGIEFEQALADPVFCREILRRERYDVVLTSVVRSPDGSPFPVGPDMTPEEIGAFAHDYAGALLSTVEKTEFDVLARPLAPLRRMRGDLSVFLSALDLPLKALAERDLALEIDTRDVIGSERIRDLYFSLLQCFRAHGGRRITIGSESYHFEDLGNGVQISIAAAKRAGFENMTFFEGRDAYEMPL